MTQTTDCVLGKTSFKPVKGFSAHPGLRLPPPIILDRPVPPPKITTRTSSILAECNCLYILDNSLPTSPFICAGTPSNIRPTNFSSRPCWGRKSKDENVLSLIFCNDLSTILSNNNRKGVTTFHCYATFLLSSSSTRLRSSGVSTSIESCSVTTTFIL